MKIKIRNFVYCLFLFMLIKSCISFADNKNSSVTTTNFQSSNSSQTASRENGDPYTEIEKLRRDFNRVLQQGVASASRGIDWAQNQNGVLNPRMDLVEEKDRYWVKVDLPGMQKDKLDVKVTDKSITVKGERTSEIQKTDKENGVYQQERSFGSFERTIPIPENVDTDKISAKYDLGVLTLDLPKIKPTTPAPDNSRKIQIL